MKKKLKYFKRYIDNRSELDFLNENLRIAIITPDKDIIPNAETLNPAYIVFDNYEKILTWNRSLRFALAVCTLKENFKNEIDILVCNAGVNNGKGDIFSDEHNENAIMEVMMVNVGGPFLTIQNLYKNLNKKTISKIVIISSLMGTQNHISNKSHK